MTNDCCCIIPGLLDVVGLYTKLLTDRPLATKCVTSAVIAAFGNCISQKIKNRALDVVKLDLRSMAAFFTYGMVVIGPLTHNLYRLLENLFPRNSNLVMIKRIAFERLIFTPCLCLITVVSLEVLQGRYANVSDSVRRMYLPTLFAHWKVWTIPQFINVNFVPEKYRALFANLVALVWNVYLAKLNSAAAAAVKAEEDKKME